MLGRRDTDPVHDGRMVDLDNEVWRDHLLLSRDIDTPGERQQFFSEVKRGAFIAIIRGVYVDAALWSRMDEDARYRTRVKAVAARDRFDPVFSHYSAAALWRLPWVGRWPSVVHVMSERSAGGRSNASLFRHTVGVPETFACIDGLVMTSLARTVVDVARVASFGQAVVVADAALRRTVHPLELTPRTFLTLSDLLNELEGVALRQGTAKVRAVINFADGAADRPGESMSRVNMRKSGLPMPVLQATIVGASGRVWTVDFWWPGSNLVGEFDGKAKYSDPVFLRGRTPEQALLDEKDREDDIRAAGHLVTRWGWNVALSPRLLRAHLVAAGLR